MKREKPYPTEVALCAAFIASLPNEWTSYAETEGWDVLLVRRADGFQIGVQAKLKIGPEVINQAIEGSKWTVTRPGPDCRAILVPESTHGFGGICAYIGITIITMRVAHTFLYGNSVLRHTLSPGLPSGRPGGNDNDWHEWAPAKRHPLPEYVPDVPAGASAPVQLTQWKIGAIKIMITLEKRGYVTREDFKAHQIDHRRWLARETQWLAKEGNVWVRGLFTPGDFRAQHPKVYAQIEGDAEKWMPKISTPHQLKLLP